MASQRHLDRKARTAVTAAVVLLLAGPLFLVARHVAKKLGGEQSEQAFHPGNDQLVTLRDGTTMLVKNSSVGSRIADWLKRETKGEQTFQVGNGNFVQGSAALSRDGWEHVTQFASMLNAHHNVRAVILFSSFHGEQPTVQLEHLRANRIEQELLKDGVDEHQVAIAPEAFEPGHNPSKDSGLEVVLTNRT